MDNSNTHEINNDTKGEIKQIETKHIIYNIKSNIILKKICNNLQRNKLLKIIKENKKTQQRLDINVNSYREYCEIEILITKSSQEGKFINIPTKEYESYYHIYFNDDKNEEKRFYSKNNDKNIRIIIDFEITSLDELFYDCECIQSIYFKRFKRNNIKSMNRMFYSCKSLKLLDLSDFKIGNSCNMNSMFFGCTSLKKIILPTNFSIDNITDMSYMFYGCSSLIDVNFPNFNKNNKINMQYMLYGCSSKFKKKMRALNYNI